MDNHAFPDTNDAIRRILEHWNVLLNYEESKSCKLYGIGESMATLEGRNYLKLPLADTRYMSFFTADAHTLKKKMDGDTSRFLLRVKLIEQRAKFRRFLRQIDFFAGYPVVEVSIKGQKPYITSLIKCILGGVRLPETLEKMIVTPGNVRKIETMEECIVFEKPSVDSDDGFSDTYFTDFNLLEEVMGIDPDRLKPFVKMLRSDNRRLDDAVLSDLFGTNPLPEPDNDTLTKLCHRCNRLFERETAFRVRFFPYGLIWFSDAGQPTYSLRKDIQSIVRQQKLDEMNDDHVFIRFFNGRSTTESLKKSVVVTADSQPPTPSQNEVLTSYASSPLYTVEGPPGTGKTKVIRDVIAGRLYALCRTLTGDGIPTNIHSLTTLVTGTNNISVDHALNFFDFSSFDDVLPCVIRLGNRNVLRSQTLPFLIAYAERLVSYNVFKMRDTFHKALTDFKTVDHTDGAVFTGEKTRRSIFYLLTLWVIQNQMPALKLLDELCEDLQENGTTRALHNRQNRELFSMMFPVIGTTLLSIGPIFPLKKSLWGLTVIDEAGQCPPQNIVSALYRTQRLILFGDVHQLEPIHTVTLEEYERLKALRNSRLPDTIRDMFIPLEGTDVSLQRIAQSASHGFSSLTEHFRCRKEIIDFCASLCGYRLNVIAKPPLPNSLLGDTPFWYMPVECNEESYSGSWLNAGEADMAVNCYIHLIRSGALPDDIIILTPFRGQMNFIQHKLRTVFFAQRRLLPKINAAHIAVATAHRFQGGERKIVVFCPVTHTKNPDFLNSRVNILNVSVSRAQEHFILIGSPENMKRGKYTAMLLDRIERHGKKLEMPQQTFNF